MKEKIIELYNVLGLEHTIKFEYEELQGIEVSLTFTKKEPNGTGCVHHGD